MGNIDTLQEFHLQQPQLTSYETGGKYVKKGWGMFVPTMLKRLAVEIFLTVVLPSSSPSSIGSSPSLPVIRPTWNSEVFETCRRMFIRILCFTPWEKSWWIPSFCFTFNWSPAFVARTSSVQRFFLCWIAIFLLRFTQDLIYGLPRGIQQNDSLLQLLLFGKNLQKMERSRWKPEAKRSAREGRRGRKACSTSQRSQRLLGTSPTFLF